LFDFLSNDLARALMKSARTLIVAGGCLLSLLLVGACDGFDEARFREFSSLPEDMPPAGGGFGGSGVAAGGTRGTSQPDAGEPGLAGAGGSSSEAGSGSLGAGASPGLGSDAGTGEGGAEQGGAGSGPPPDPESCGTECAVNGGTCNGDTCRFDCSSSGTCMSGQIICPPNTPCDVRCGSLGCTDNVICSPGATCSIRCEGLLACPAEVICNGDCEIECSGPRACAGGIGGDPMRLQLECSGALSCGGATQCQGPDCQIACTGTQACEQVVAFGNVNVVRCEGDRSCSSEVFCSGAA
jgi:hypothetical protein